MSKPAAGNKPLLSLIYNSIFMNAHLQQIKAREIWIKCYQTGGKESVQGYSKRPKKLAKQKINLKNYRKHNEYTRYSRPVRGDRVQMDVTKIGLKCYPFTAT